METANLTVLFQTNDPDQLIENLESTTTMISHTNTVQSKESSDYIIFVLYHPTNIEKTLTEITSYPNTFINRAMYLDKAQSLEDNETVRTTIATTIINQFDNRHKTIYYQDEPISNTSDYLKNKKFKNSIDVIQFDNKLHCTLYSQTDEKTYIFEAKNLQEKETTHGKNR
jgi:hypothetical protein